MNLGRHSLAHSSRCGIRWHTPLSTDCTKIRIKVGYELSVQITLIDKLNQKMYARSREITIIGEHKEATC